MKATLLLSLLLMGLLGYWFWPEQHAPKPVLVVGALSGTLAERDLPMMEALRDGLRQKAEAEGISLQLHIVDSQQAAADLKTQVADILSSGVDTVMGCGDSACVRTLLPVLQQSGALLLYPGSSEGLIDSAHLIHLGPVANQFLFPAVSWIRDNLGQRVMFIGSESARSHMLHRLMQDQLLADESVELIDAEFIGSQSELPQMLSKVTDYRPDVVLFDACEWYGDQPFMSGLNRQPGRVFSLCTDQLPPSDSSLFFVSAYFDNPHNPENRRLRAQYPQLSPLMVNVDWMLTMWGRALAAGHGEDMHHWLEYLRSHNDLTAAGPVLIDQHFQGSWRGMAIQQQVAGGGQNKLLWISDSMLRPVMYPGIEAPSDWKHFLTIFWRNAGGEWRTAVMKEERG
ncbi:transporter substrate-binding protein [Thalassolituus sp. LLYu03]|uniref:transporter substrate-binding protein n=1 Tax=Thalassolituus sp. LLYu03 TaxID=3421656 RepID=UPI003D2C520E